ncbi:MAG: hypothetical protein AAB490_00570 [Patescibacteria group bacterium]
MDAGMLILLSLKNQGLSYDALKKLLDEELGDRSPARSSNDFVYELDELVKDNLVRQEDKVLILTEEGQNVIRSSRTLRFIVARMTS